jgi:putative acetyltransferase
MVVIRRAGLADKEAIWRVHTAAIRETCKSHYTQEEIEAWAGARKPESYGLSINTGDFFVAEENRVVAGFGHLNREKGEIEAVYVRPNFERRGIGSKILRTLEDAARAHGLTSLHLSSSLNAVGFYERAGYEPQHEAKHPLQGGIEIPCVHMVKELKS